MVTIPANTSTDAILAPGDSTTSQIDVQGDRDWFRTELLGGYNDDLRLRGIGTDPLDNVRILGYDADGVAIFDRQNFGDNGSVVFTPNSDGVYFIAAAGQVGF